MSDCSEQPRTFGAPQTPTRIRIDPEHPSLSAIAAAPDYAARVSEVAVRIASATDQATALALLEMGVRELGADHAVLVSFVRDSVDLSTCRFMLVCEPDWCQRYLEAGCFAHDPWLAYAAHHSEPIPASKLPVLDPEDQRVVSVRRTRLELELRSDNDHVQLTNSWTRWKRKTVASAGATGQS